MSAHDVSRFFRSDDLVTHDADGNMELRISFPGSVSLVTVLVSETLAAGLFRAAPAVDPLNPYVLTMRITNSMRHIMGALDSLKPEDLEPLTRRLETLARQFEEESNLLKDRSPVPET